MELGEDKTKLSNEAVDKELKDLPGWFRDGSFLKKDFIFTNYRQINTFLPYLTDTIVKLNHHPDFSFESGKKKVSIEVTTHSEGGLTKSDIKLARTLNLWQENAG